LKSRRFGVGRSPANWCLTGEAPAAPDVAKILGLGNEDMPMIGYARVSSRGMANVRKAMSPEDVPEDVRNLLSAMQILQMRAMTVYARLIEECEHDAPGP
jgi:hypothetical protein